MKRSELYAAIWREPMTRVAAGLDISDTGLKKVCRRYDVPMPPRGYWAKAGAGKPVIPTELTATAEDPEIELRKGLTHAIPQKAWKPPPKATPTAFRPAATREQPIQAAKPTTGDFAAGVIRIEITRGATSVSAWWPVSAAAECGAWTRGLLE